MPVIFMVLSAAGWLLVVVLFEAGYQALRANGHFNVQKGNACRMWWLFLCVCSLVGGVGQFLFSLPFLGTIGISHCKLAETNEGVITVFHVLSNIPQALREFAAKLKPFIK
jgi:hypothetical protein